jgi:hypothetical protein
VANYLKREVKMDYLNVLHQGSGYNGEPWYAYSGDGAHWGEDMLVQNLGNVEFTLGSRILTA